MPFQWVKVDISGEEYDGVDVELLSDLLMELGAVSVSVEDALRGTDAEKPLFHEPLPGNGVEWIMPADAVGGKTYWPKCTVKALFTEDAAVESVIMTVGAELNLPRTPQYEAESVRNEDWVVKVQQSFKPIQIGRILITFPWHSDAETASMREASPVIIQMSPGMAFGTGEHWTTQLVLQWLQDAIEGDEKVLDYGAGSGVLAIAGLKLGAARARLVEIDQEALSTSQSNAERNTIEDRCEFFLPENEPEPSAAFDITVANILAEPLRKLAPLLAAHTRCGGKVALSGILAMQASGLCDVYSQWFDMKQAAVDSGWALLTGVKRES
uniref:ETFB lysine methyltransferase n=1 Tax=Timspurckia oligopyrenoides TaxID=708627 RepID=A0A6T6NQS7_9RHOD|mmetsp:Transcript_6600/g.11779  ORF Transcript_6600/g.11779 Transcript_6600/m.11779 type:complete len:326 (+) Transcript_6600:56-1033(+)|eukprot:CAMPEP_0182445522 /NCGR_PEP_ID=MMETSP1172-20130603/3619_1 /TAXON_ID=708627 /ORGANISM="Timspurckia oligopyrenoides, Strain CCMP3278" /LENGTH=325 /DNA_ID=CAMNT_0024641311 /DNA_START=12 /DNA_END=989 /DNA_ORIENTATION=+